MSKKDIDKRLTKLFKSNFYRKKITIDNNNHHQDYRFPDPEPQYLSQKTQRGKVKIGRMATQPIKISQRGK